MAFGWLKGKQKKKPETGNGVPVEKAAAQGKENAEQTKPAELTGKKKPAEKIKLTETKNTTEQTKPAGKIELPEKTKQEKPSEKPQETPEQRMAKTKISGSGYAVIENSPEGEVRLSLEEDKDWEGCEYALVLVSRKTKKRTAYLAEKKEGCYTVKLQNLEALISGEREIFRCYFAVSGEKVKTSFRLWMHQKQNYDDSLIGTIQPDVGRYGTVMPLAEYEGKKYAAVFYKAEYSDEVSLLVDTEERCQKLAKGELKVISAQKNYEYPYKFSVVMAVYNAEDYLEEAIDSVLNQTIRFQENIQMILSDDGSTDTSPAICDAYAARFPQNITVLHKENGGVSSARNEGKKLATGKYVNFMDSDDKFEETVFEKVWNFFEKHQDETDVVTIPMHFFGAETGEHWQNYKFEEGSRIINLRKEYTASCMVVNASFVKHEQAKKHFFDEDLPISEDLKFMMEILIEKFALGVVHDCNYLYRRRTNGILSLVQSSKQKKIAYNGYLEHVTEYMMHVCREKFGYVPRYAQNTLMMDLQWKMRMPEIPEGVLEEEEQEQFVKNMIRLACQFEDEVILNQRIIMWEVKYFLFKQKYGDALRQEKVFKDIVYTVQGNEIRRMSQMRTAIDILHIENGILYIEGNTTFYGVDASENVETYLCIGDRLLKCQSVDRSVEKESILGKLAYTVPFRMGLPISEDMLGKKIYFYHSIDQHAVLMRRVKYGKLTPFYNQYKNEYYVNENYVLTYAKNYLEVKALENMQQRMEYEERLINEIKNDMEQGMSEKKDFIESDEYKGLAETLALRKAYFEAIGKKEGEIWLVSDRINEAGDNGEAFFAYLQKIKPENTDTYFVISEESPDYARLKEIGTVVPYQSQEHLMLALLADKVISAHADEGVRDAFWQRKTYLKDLYKYKFVFLQHGIIHNDLSLLLNKYNKNIALFVTSVPLEYDSIAHGKYLYTEKEVKMTGLPRYDLLVQDRPVKKQVLFTPTWRKYISMEMNLKEGKRNYNKAFKETDYYQFYQGILSDETLLAAMEERGYTARFLVHPILRENSIDFKGNSLVEIVAEDVVYKNEFIENALLVTDYSSVAFDFAYLKKPVIYTQFDREYMYRYHTVDKGYWDYDTMGFGPVCKTKEETVAAIIDAMDRGCKLEADYLKRIESFYYKFDQKNCERVYQAICEL